MERTTGQESVSYPLVRIFTLGDFALERLAALPSQDGSELHYERFAPEVWANRGPAMTLLKILLSRANRRASRGELTEVIWPGNTAMNVEHALDSAASVLRRRVLATSEGGSLLLTIRSGGETIFKLPAQHRVWVDADALLEMVSGALRAEHRGQTPIPPLEMALSLARGEFLEDDLYAEWSQARRHTVNGARRRAQYKLVRLYQQDGREEQAEELLFRTLEEDPSDEDALCHLMLLLVEQERRQEALQLYQYSLDVMQEEQNEPATYTRELAHRIRQGLVLRERGNGYVTARTRTASPLQTDAQGKYLIDGDRFRHTFDDPGELLTKQMYVMLLQSRLLISAKHMLAISSSKVCLNRWNGFTPVRLLQQPGMSIRKVAHVLGTSRGTIQRLVEQEGIEL